MWSSELLNDHIFNNGMYSICIHKKVVSINLAATYIMIRFKLKLKFLLCI